jgi:hypothetical protein
VEKMARKQSSIDDKFWKEAAEFLSENTDGTTSLGKKLHLAYAQAGMYKEAGDAALARPAPRAYKNAFDYYVQAGISEQDAATAVVEYRDQHGTLAYGPMLHSILKKAGRWDEVIEHWKIQKGRTNDDTERRIAEEHLLPLYIEAERWNDAADLCTYLANTSSERVE